MIFKSALNKIKDYFNENIAIKSFDPLINILLISIILTSAYIILSQNTKFKFLSQKQQLEKTSPSPSFKPSPRPIPHGPKGFTVSGGIQNAPQFSEGQIIPYDPEQGTNQKIKIQITSQTPVQKATTTMITDNQEKPINMELIEGTETDGTWQTEWQIDDTYLYTYKARIEAENNQNTQVATLTLR